jgi:hypothetical protein
VAYDDPADPTRPTLRITYFAPVERRLVERFDASGRVVQRAELSRLQIGTRQVCEGWPDDAVSLLAK